MSCRHATAPTLIGCIPLRPVREERRVPAKEPIWRQGLIVALGRVEHHFHYPLDVAVGRRQTADVHAETTSER